MKAQGLDPKHTKAMIMAAGLGTRMRPLTDTRPKPLVVFAGKALIDHGLNRLEQAGIGQVVVNVHYLADKLEAHLQARKHPKILMSDERSTLLDTGGGAKKALGTLGPEAFIVLNSDSVWLENGQPLFDRLMRNWNAEHMDCLLMLSPRDKCLGYDGDGDFTMDETGKLARKRAGDKAEFVNIGAYIIHPDLFAKAPSGPFSMNLLWDQALEKGRLFGLKHEGSWMHLGTPEALKQAELKLQVSDKSAGA